MSTYYQETYYSYKTMPRQIALVNGEISAIGSSVVATGPTINPAESETEIKIQRYISLGNSEYQNGRYAPALDYYLHAWKLLPKSLWPNFPFLVTDKVYEVLVAADLNKHLLEKTALSLKNMPQEGPIGPLPPIYSEPPAEIASILDKMHIPPVDKAEQFLERGVHKLRSGELKEATQDFRRAVKYTDDDEIKLQAKIGIANVLVRLNDHKKAIEQFNKLRSKAQKSGLPQLVATIEHNMGVIYSMIRKTKEAEEFFRSIKNQDISENSLASGTINFKKESFRQSINTLPYSLVMYMNNSWNFIDASSSISKEVSFIGYAGNETIIIDLNRDVSKEVENKLLTPRINASSLSQLDLHLELMPQFISYLSHVGGFILPMAIGDCYTALGEYDNAITYYNKAKNYKYLNLAIERSVVWIRMAKAYLRKGMRLFRNRDNSGARSCFENIVKIVDGQIKLSGILYNGTFSTYKSVHKNFLESNNKSGFSSVSFERRILLLDAFSRLNQILAGFNYLGLPENIVPIHSWHYLQNLARYFAKQAIAAERAYINFRDAAEKEEVTRLLLEQSIQSQKAAEKVEERRVQASNEQRNVALLSANVANVRLDNAIDRKADFEAVSAELAVLEEINGWATGPMDKAKVDSAWADVLGLEPGTYDTYQVVRHIAALRSQISNAYELRDKQRQIEELQASKVVADAQISVADKMLEMAEAQLELAQLRVEHAEEQLAAFEGQEFTPELWHALADAQKEISEHYLDQAINISFLMERAYEFEYDLDINRIRFDYTRSELQGLLSADFLLQDIDSFSYDRIMQSDKQIPVKTSISLADRYPYQFFNEFMRTGKLEFETLLEDFDLVQPGAHIRKLCRIEVVVEGAIGREGLKGLISNSGISQYRDRNGDLKVRQQKPETQLLSLYDIRRDGFIFTLEDSVLNLFENSGVASGWTLEIPPESNDINYQSISNIHLVFYYDTYFSKSIEHRVRAENTALAIYERQLGFRLSSHFPDEFFALQDTGMVNFNLESGYLPQNQSNYKIKDCRIVVQTEKGISPQNIVLTVTLQNSCISIDQTTDINGMINTDTATASLNGIRNSNLEDTWSIFFDKDKNSAAISAGFDWDKVTDVYLFTEYSYTPRGHSIIRDDFESDPMAGFDIVDDALATNSSPSSWSYNANGYIQQTSNIYGGPAGASNTSPNRPGTYLIRKESAEWIKSRDFCLRVTLRSTDNDGIGLVFRYIDENNFYYFLMDSQRSLFRLGKKVSGTFSELDVAAKNSSVSPDVPGTNYDISVSVIKDNLVVALNDNIILVGQDNDLLLPGCVGLYSWGNSGAHFHNMELENIREIM